MTVRAASNNYPYPSICTDDAQPLCAATYSTDADWIHLDTSSFYVTSNGGKFRTAQILYHYENEQSIILTINQEIGCPYTLSETESPLLNASGISQTFKLTTECGWTLLTNDDWIILDETRSGNGNATIGYSVAPNTGAARTGKIWAGGLVFTVSQAGN